jgi:hypothetical protein
MGVAYLDFSGSELRPATAHQRVAEFPRHDLDARERGAILLARTDGKESLHNPGRLRRLSEICFGLSRQSNKLADPRLEGLRRYAVAVARDTEQSATHEREQLVDLGFSEHQIQIAAATAVRFRAKPARGLWSAVALVSLVGGAFWGIDQYLEDWLIALVVAMAMTVPIVAFAGPRASF